MAMIDGTALNVIIEHRKKLKIMHEKLYFFEAKTLTMNFFFYDNANVSATTWHHSPTRPSTPNHIKAHLTVAAYAEAYTHIIFYTYTHTFSDISITAPLRNW